MKGFSEWKGLRVIVLNRVPKNNIVMLEEVGAEVFDISPKVPKNISMMQKN